MERISLKYRDACRSLETLVSIQKEFFSVIVRDAAIQRFESTFEAFGKYLQEYLKVKEGIVANSPKAVFRELFSLKILTEEQTVHCLEMTDRRNDTAHTYKEKVAQIIYDKLQGFTILIENVLQKTNTS